MHTFKKLVTPTICSLVWTLTASSGHAQPFAGSGAGGAMPWDGPLSALQASLTGTVARVCIMVAIIVAGIGLAFGENGGVWRRVCFVVFGGAIVFGAASIVALLGGTS